MNEAAPAFTCERHCHLFELQRRVARRADELARILGNSPGQSFELWRQAESELWQEICSNDVSLKAFTALSATPDPDADA